MTHRLTAIGNTQNKTETLSNKVILIYYKHIHLEILKEICCRESMDFAANRSTVVANRLQSLKRLNRELSLSASVRVDVSSASHPGIGSIVWLLPSLHSF